MMCIGKKTDPMFVEAVNHYQKRIDHMAKFEAIMLSHSAKDGVEARAEDTQAILAKLHPSDIVLLMDERGRNFTSEQLAGYVESAQNQSKNLVVVIGGAYGVSDELRTRADAILAFGTSVFPHQLMRVMVSEQLYRALSITQNSSYHHA